MVLRIEAYLGVEDKDGTGRLKSFKDDKIYNSEWTKSLLGNSIELYNAFQLSIERKIAATHKKHWQGESPAWL